jgi:pimeloyl-ACP methyl ester carboxylesterase
MTDEDIGPLQQELRRLYGRQAFAEALDLLERHPGLFDQPSVMYHWRMCVAARANQPDRAIEAFSEAISHGHAYSAAMIRDDQDLATLQGLPAFEELAQRSLERMAETRRGARPELVLVPPAGPEVHAAPLLLGLHGNAQNARLSARDWSPIVDRGWLLACAQSTQMLTTDAYGWNDLARGASDVRTLYSALDVGGAIDPDRVVMGGFSMGGGLAIELAVTGAIPARGFIVVGPYVPDLALLEPYVDAAAARGLRGYIVMGLLEAPEGQDLIRGIPPFLSARGIPCELEERPGLAHAFPEDFDQTLERALAFLI